MSADRAAFEERFDVSRETLAGLDIYHDLLLRWTKRINLVSPRSTDQVWKRHFWDSAQLFHIIPSIEGRWIDLGSGGGFPGLVIAILAQDSKPLLSVRLVESDQRKATFLRTVARETGVTADIVAERIEAARSGNATILSARALAPLATLLGHAARHLSPDGTALFPKGARYRDEMAEALETWRFDCEEYPSETDAEAVILKIGGIGRV